MCFNPPRSTILQSWMLWLAFAVAISACGADMSPDDKVLNGCTEARFVDRSASSADRTVTFGFSSNVFAYSPRCITVAMGQTVTFLGDLSVHPIAPGTSPSAANVGTAGNPIPRTETGGVLRVTFPNAGVYPYFCVFHYAGGMAGVVRVR